MDSQAERDHTAVRMLTGAELEIEAIFRWVRWEICDPVTEKVVGMFLSNKMIDMINLVKEFVTKGREENPDAEFIFIDENERGVGPFRIQALVLHTDRNQGAKCIANVPLDTENLSLFLEEIREGVAV